jgi:hypothetical protein
MFVEKGFILKHYIVMIKQVNIIHSKGRGDMTYVYPNKLIFVQSTTTGHLLRDTLI